MMVRICSIGHNCMSPISYSARIALLCILLLVSTASAIQSAVNGTKPYKLVIVCTFKNEGLLMGEWMQHYIDEGVDHFYLIDHGSTDSYLDVLKTFPKNMITLRHDFTPQRHGLQDELMNKYFSKRVKVEAEWVLVVDVDEYLYPAGDNQCLSDIVDAFNPEVNRIWMPWKVFGSNGHKNQPKEGVIASFTKRAVTRVEVNQLLIGYGKTLVRVADTLYLRTHASDVKVKPHFYLSDGRYIDPRNNVTKDISWVDEAIVTSQSLQLNHYMFQSMNYYEQHKCTRGGGQSGMSYKYTMKYYYKTEPQANKIVDDGLLRRKGGALATKKGKTKKKAIPPQSSPSKCRSKYSTPNGAVKG